MTQTAHNLCLHYVDTSSPKRILALSEKQLHDVVDREIGAGRRAVSLVEYLGTTPPSDNCFTVSFDDAHRSVLTHAAPLLRKRSVPVALFVPVLWVGTSDEWLSWDDLRSLRDLGVDIGSHSMAHPRFSWRMYDEDDAAYRARLADECERSREALERELGTRCELFAYPYGEDPREGREAVRRAGYKAAFTVRDNVNWDGDALSIPRVDAFEAHGYAKPRSAEPLPISVILPARDRTPILRETLSRLAQQSYPEDRYEVIVVDDGSKENLSQLVDALPKRFSLLQSGTNDGVFRAGHARNVGARAARHSTLAFLDADIAVPSDYLWALDWIHQRHDDAVVYGYLSGYNLHDLGYTHSLRQLQGVEALEAVPVIPDRSREPTARACLDNVDWLSEPWRLCYTGNLSTTRSLFDRVGGFSTAFEGWGLEDIDIGVRLAKASHNHFFSRFALGYHLVDEHEPAPRNPFRRSSPTRDDFAGYLVNLRILERLHPADAGVAAFVARALADIDETCGRPDTVGVEFGGNVKRAAPFHRRLHRTTPGGIGKFDLLDRVAYAQKVAAKGLWFLGGEPAEHVGFFDVLDAAKKAGIKHVGMQSHGHAFSDAALAKGARARGLGHVTLIWSGMGPRHDARYGIGAWRDFEAGLAHLRDADIHLSARVVLADAVDVREFDEAHEYLTSLGVETDEISADEGLDLDVAARAIGRPVVRLTP